MLNPVFIPLDSLEAEEDNEPPSLEKGLDLLACPCVCMGSPALSLTSKPKAIRHLSLFSGTDVSRNLPQGQRLRIALSGWVGEVLTFFPWRPVCALPRC